MSNYNKLLEKKYVFHLPNHPRLSENIIMGLDNLFDYAPPENLRNTLLEIYHTYIIREYETLPTNFESMANDMYFLFNFLGIAVKENKSP